MPDRVCLDTSFLVHAILPIQRTDESGAALRDLLLERTRLIAAPTAFVEFSSLLRKMVNQGRMSPGEAQEKFSELLALRPVQAPMTDRLISRAWEIATLLGQSDTFDALGYAVAEAYSGEFWTSDTRFANAARRRGLTHLRLIP